MRTLLLLALAASLSAQTTQSQGYHIVTSPPGESHATPAASTAPTAGARRIRRPAARRGKAGATLPGIKTSNMSGQITGRIRKH